MSREITKARIIFRSPKDSNKDAMRTKANAPALKLVFDAKLNPAGPTRAR
jgi:hypothetical protein